MRETFVRRLRDATGGPVLRGRSLIVAAGLVAACSSESGQGPSDGTTTPEGNGGPVADIRADSNRDGEIRFDESDATKADWNATTGAVFLANIDDDEERCKKSGDDLTIAKCNDAADEVINGEADLADLAPIATRPWAEAPEGTTARITVTPESARPFIRIFRRTQETGDPAADYAVVGDEDVLSVADVRAGIHLAIEAKDIVRDRDAWDGYVSIGLAMTVPPKAGESAATATEVSDAVKLRVAPVLTSHHLQPAEEVWVSNTGTPGNRAMRSDLGAACEAAKLAAPSEVDDEDPWTQDFFETAYMSMPGKNGAQHVVHVNYRSANLYSPNDKKAPLRPAGQVVFRMRGKDSAGIQQYDPKHSLEMDSLNSFGNFETVPPHTKDGASFPFGRVLRGRTTSFYPDASFAKMIDAQGQQPAIDIDTSWLYVGHVDETLSFVKANTPRGWVLLANDARLARKMLEDEVAAGHGDTPLFVDKTWFDFDTGEESPAQTTIANVLADTDVMKASAEAAAEVDAQVAKIQKEVGLADDEIVHVPFLHMEVSGLSIAYQPGMVNGIYLADGRFGAPDPHGPVVAGKDIFKKAMEDALAPHGITISWIEDWEYHISAGEVHCGTNTRRHVPAAKWWEAGR